MSVIDTTSGAVTSTLPLTSEPLQITFANPPEATQTTLTTDPSSGSLSISNYSTGSQITYTATVTPYGSTTAIGSTTGTVSFADATGVLDGLADSSQSSGSCGQVALVSGVASCTVTYDSVGSDTVTAT